MKSVSQNSASWKVISLVVFLISLLAIGTSIYFYLQLQKVGDPIYQQALVEKETREILTKVGLIYDLPEGIPQIAVVSNPEELKKGQPFFDKAMIGDRILIYPTQAVLYRPDTHQIINIWPVNRADAPADGSTVSPDA
jgi:hypothetical protein